MNESIVSNCCFSRRTLLQGALGAAALALAPAPALASGDPGRFAFRDVRVFDGRRVLDRATVLTARGRIAAVLPGPVRIPADARVVDGRGRTLLPGLIDAHIHDLGFPRTDPPRFGVTTELDMFNFVDRLRRDLGDYVAQRRSYRPTASADLWTAGTMITVPGGHGSQLEPPLPPDFPWLRPGDDPARHVDRRLAEGSDYVKFVVEPMHLADPWPSVSPSQARAIVRRARQRGVLSLAHVSTVSDARWLCEAGVDGLIHTPTSHPIDAGTLRLARRSGVFVTSTLAIFHALEDQTALRAVFSDPRVAPYVSAAQRALIDTPYPPDFPGDPIDLELAAANVRALHAAGVPILAGTDGANPGIPNGVGLLAELELLVAAGLRPQDALAAATANPARAFGLADRGRIAPGRRADLVLVDGDPTRDITDLRSISGVWRNGAQLDR